MQGGCRAVHSSIAGLPSLLDLEARRRSSIAAVGEDRRRIGRRNGLKQAEPRVGAPGSGNADQDVCGGHKASGFSLECYTHLFM